MQYLLAIVGALASLVGILWTKKKSAEALLQNTDTKEKVLDLEKARMLKQAAEQAEELKRDVLKKSAEDRKNDPVDPGDFN